MEREDKGKVGNLRLKKCVSVCDETLRGRLVLFFI